MNKNHIFIAGIPGCGKSTFGKWLENTKGYVHIDMENDGLDAHGLRIAWESYYNGKDPESFISLLNKQSGPVVLDWGFPPSCISIVQRIKESGVKLSWFDGDRLAARQFFKVRNTVPLENFDIQYARISEQWKAIGALFGDNIIKIVLPDGTRFDDQTIYTHIFGKCP